MKFPIWVPLVVAALLALLGSVFTVREGEAAIVLNLGRVVRTDIGPGLHFKWPLIESAREFDRRLTVLDAEPERYLTSERKDVSVDFFAIGRIEDLRAFYRATCGDESAAIARLAPIIKDALRNEINSRTLSQVVSGDRSDIVKRQLAGINKGAATLGVRILDLRIKQVESQLRAEGDEAAQKIVADADRDRQVIEAEAERDAQKLRGEGDAQAASIYAQAANKDPGFYAFQRSLEAYRASFKDGNTVIVLDKDDPFLQYMKSDR